MRTQTIEVYQFQELSQKAQEMALEASRYINIDYDWHEYIIEQWIEKLALEGFLNAKINFSGFGSQGDGACFTAEIDIDKLSMVGMFEPLNDIKDLFSFKIVDRSGRYSYELTKFVQYEWNGNNDLFEHEGIESLIEILCEHIELNKKNLCLEIYADLEDEYNERISDEHVKESLVLKEIEFKENGEIFV